MPTDVERQLAALGMLWNQTLAPVDVSEVDARIRSRLTDQPFEQATEEEATVIDFETSNQVDRHRKVPQRLVLAALATAAAIAITVVATRNDDTPSPADEPSTTAFSTTPARALFETPDAPLTSGTYVVDEVEGMATTPLFVTIGEGWSTFGTWGITKGEGQGVTFSRPDRVFWSACHPSDGDQPGSIDSLDGLTTALYEQQGWINVTTPTEITIDDFSGRAFQRSTPPDLSECPGDFTSWSDPIYPSSYPPGDTETVWVLDLDGTMVVVEGRVNAGQPDEAHAELAAVLDSIRIGQI